MHSPAVENNALEHRKIDTQSFRSFLTWRSSVDWIVIRISCTLIVSSDEKILFFIVIEECICFFLSYLCKLEAVGLLVHPSKAVSNFCLLFSFNIRFWDELSLAKLIAFQRCITCICRWRKIAAIRTFTESIPFKWPFVCRAIPLNFTVKITNLWRKALT